MKKAAPIILVIVLAIAAIVFAVYPRHNDTDTNEVTSEEITERSKSDVSYADENEDEILQTVKKDPESFLGTWEAPSDKATGLYGNIDITINEDGTWKGSITEEPLTGRWVQKNDRLHLTSELFSFDLAFSKSGNLVFIDEESDGTIIVLKKKK